MQDLKQPDEQFAAGLRLLQRAFAAKSEVSSAMEDRLRAAEDELNAAVQKTKQLAAEKQALQQENESLQIALKKAQREISQLIQFRQAVLSSIQTADPGLGTQFSDLTVAAPTASGVSSLDATAATFSANATSKGMDAVDGKDFFRRARARLDYAAFQEFLAAIKRLNNHMQSKAETLAQARGIFVVSGNEDMLEQFEKLLENHRD
jgi:hypothetical protein